MELNGLTDSTLGEVCSLVTDGTHDTPRRVESGYPLVKAKEIVSGRIDFETCDQISEEEHLKVVARSKPEFGDTLFAHIGASLGEAAFVNTTREFSIKNIALFKPNPAVIDARYLYYLVISPAFQALAKGTKTGSAQPFLGLSQLRDHLIRYNRDLTIQCWIARILWAYDELIETNQRRIRILEEMARALYREWFVDFRFPGHKKITHVASPLGDILPGWEITDLAKVCTEGNGIQTGPFGSQLHESDYSDDGVPVVMPKDLIGFRIQTDSIARIPEETADKLGRHRMQLGDIVYGRRGDIGRRAYLMPHQVGWFCGTGCLRIRPNPRAVNGWYLFNYLGQDDVVGLITGRAQGVTMPNLNTGVMASVPVRLPTRRLQDDFTRLTFPMAEAREALTAKIENLRRTRDLLLPRLLSGQVNLETN